MTQGLGVSIELVPRSREALTAELARVRSALPSVDRVNIPDLLRFPLRSWQACAIARRHVRHAIPHLRAVDFDPGRLDVLKARLATAGLDEVIVVQGETPEGAAPATPTTSLELIRALRAASPDLRIWAALDPYRASPRRELEYARAKREAGADGFFTQPFFDLRFQDVWADLLAGENVWWGVTPILTAGNRRYWERRNLAFLPPDFEPTLAWNRRHAARTIPWARDRGDAARLYFMPIRTDLETWLGGLL